MRFFLRSASLLALFCTLLSAGCAGQMARLSGRGLSDPNAAEPQYSQQQGPAPQRQYGISPASYQSPGSVPVANTTQYSQNDLAAWGRSRPSKRGGSSCFS